MRRPLLMVVLFMAVLSPHSTKANGSPCFPATGQCIGGRFRAYWEQNGGLPAFGLPISAVEAEVNQDTGRTFLTQWFERARLELHPELQAPYDVLQGRVGADQLAQQRGPGASREQGPREGCLWFEQTGHSVCDQDSAQGFKTYWQTHGLIDPQLSPADRSLALFGLPLTGVRTGTNSSGDTVATQWFERARFEWHPREPVVSKVLLGRIGSDVLAAPDTLRGATSGIVGRITIGPTCPVERPGAICQDRPYQAALAVAESASARPIMLVMTPADGQFVLALAPGLYTLSPQSPAGTTYPRAAAVTVTVVPDQFANITIRFDSGIR